MTIDNQLQSAPRMRIKHRDQVSAQLINEFNYDNPMRVPTLQKIAVNMGLGEAIDNGNAIESATNDLMAITGQRPFAR